MRLPAAACATALLCMPFRSSPVVMLANEPAGTKSLGGSSTPVVRLAAEPGETKKSLRGIEARWQKLIDTGKAATLEEAKVVAAKHAIAGLWQKIIDSGEASNVEEAKVVAGRRASAASWQKLVDSGQASDIAQAKKMRAKAANKAYLEQYDAPARRQRSSENGVKEAVKRGYRVGKYHGVRWQKKQDSKTNKVLESGPVQESKLGFWRVQFRFDNKRYNVGSASGYMTEEDAARAMDTYVREKGMDKPLHFPDEVS